MRFEVLPTVIKNLIIVNVLIFLAQITVERYGSGWLDEMFALRGVNSDYFRPHQLVTYMFMHGGWFHIFFNMLALWMFGSTLENVWGAKKFLIFYVLCGIGAGLCQLAVQYIDYTRLMNQLGGRGVTNMNDLQYIYARINAGTVGASGAIFGCLAAFGYLFPNSIVYMGLLLPMKAKWFVLLYAGIELVSGLSNNPGDNVAHWAHLGGALVGFLLVLYWNKTNRRGFY